MTIDSSAAQAALDSAARSTTALRRRTNGLRWAMIAFAVATSAGLLLVGLAPRPLGIILGTVLVGGAGSALGAAGAASAALPPRFRRRYITAIGAWAVLYTLVLVVGLLAFPGSVPFWAAGALLSALPGLWFTTTTRAH